MDPSKLPTDNLYKFVAIAGLAGGLATIYLEDQNRTQFQQTVLTLNSKVMKGVADFHQLLPYGEMIGAPDEIHEPLPNHLSMSWEDRERYLRHLQMHLRILITLCQIPDPKDPNAAAQWQGYFRLTPEQYDEWLADPEKKKFREINKQAWALRVPHDETFSNLNILWSELDRYSWWKRVYFWSGIGFAVMTVVGFVAWYYMVQRHLDRVTRHEADDTGIPLRPNFFLRAFQVSRATGGWMVGKIRTAWASRRGGGPDQSNRDHRKKKK